jgi:hypothetical protein
VPLSPPAKLGGLAGLGTISEPVPVAYPVPMLALYPVPVDTTGAGTAPASAAKTAVEVSVLDVLPVATPESSPLFVAAEPFSPQAPAAKVATKNAASHSRVQFVMALLPSNKGAAPRNRPNRVKTGPLASSTKRNPGHADRGRVLLGCASATAALGVVSFLMPISDFLMLFVEWSPTSAQWVKCDTAEGCAQPERTRGSRRRRPEDYFALLRAFSTSCIASLRRAKIAPSLALKLPRFLPK